jgi:hypothetical protein
MLIFSFKENKKRRNYKMKTKTIEKENVEEFKITERNTLEAITIGVNWENEDIYYYQESGKINEMHNHTDDLPLFFREFMEEYDNDILPLLANMNIFEVLYPTNYELRIERTY